MAKKGRQFGLKMYSKGTKALLTSVVAVAAIGLPLTLLIASPKNVQTFADSGLALAKTEEFVLPSLASIAPSPSASEVPPSPSINVTPAPTKTPTPTLPPKQIPKPKGYSGVLVNIYSQLPVDFKAENIVRVQNYISADLLTLNANTEKANADALEALKELLLSAKADGMTGYYLQDGYRTYNKQRWLWGQNTSSTPPYSVAPPLASEHLTGLAFDLGINGKVLRSFESPQGEWLLNNAHKFGFIHRYPNGKSAITGIIFEPWHFRYVGTEIAKYIYNNNLTFEEYHASIKEVDIDSQEHVLW